MKNNRCESNDRKMQDQLLGWKMQEQNNKQMQSTTCTTTRKC